MSRAAATIRAAAADACAAVVYRGRSLDTALAVAHADVSAKDAATVSMLSYGTLRHWHALDHLLSQLMHKPLPKKEARARSLLLIGLYQLWQTRIADHAVVNATVDATRLIQRKGLRGLVNGVLRQFQRERHTMLESLQVADTAIRASHPNWIVDQLGEDWPDDRDNILAANNRQAPMWLRVNLRHGTRDAYLSRLNAIVETPALISNLCPAAIRLAQPLAVSQLPGFDQGDVSVQDLAPQLVAGLLEARPGMRVLDACAAPGGKAAHLQEAADNQLELLALDVDAERLERVHESFARLRLDATILAGDAANPDRWWDGRAFDRIVIDAPCSASGVIRRHPDIKHLRRAGDLPVLAARQQQLLRALWPLVAEGGCLLFATCSIFRAENGAVVQEFTRDTANVRLDNQLRDGNISGVMRAEPYGLSMLPGTQEADGFFISRLWREP